MEAAFSDFSAYLLLRKQLLPAPGTKLVVPPRQALVLLEDFGHAHVTVRVLERLELAEPGLEQIAGILSDVVKSLP
jgi:hypothetical protein